MMLPKFTIRHILIAMTLLAVLCVVVSFAIKGQSWAIALSVALAGANVMFVFYAVTFLITTPTMLIDAALRMRQQPTTPFATNQPPPQILPPEDPE